MGSRGEPGILGKFCQWAQHPQGCGEEGLCRTLGRVLGGRGTQATEVSSAGDLCGRCAQRCQGRPLAGVSLDVPRVAEETRWPGWGGEES